MTQSDEWRRIYRGIALSVSLAIATFAVTLFLTSVVQSVISNSSRTPNWAYSSAILLSVLGYFIGLSQLIYILPLVIVFWRRRNYGVMKGVMIGAVLVALVNFGCFVWFTSQFR